MAEIRLDLSEAEGDLPAICICCGAPATCSKAKKLFWWPRWTYLFLLIHPMVWGIIALLVSRRAVLKAPFCDRHRRHWTDHSLLIWSVGAGCVLLAVAAFVLSLVFPVGPDDAIFWGASLGVVILAVLWLVVVVIVHQSTVRPRIITRSEIVVTCVSEAFVQAVLQRDREQREASESRDDAAQASRRRLSSEAIREADPRQGS